MALLFNDVLLYKSFVACFSQLFGWWTSRIYFHQNAGTMASSAYKGCRINMVHSDRKHEETRTNSI